MATAKRDQGRAPGGMAEPKRRSLADLGGPPEKQWQTAIDHWLHRRPGPLEGMLKRSDQIPLNVRLWIIDALAGNVKQKRGRSVDYSIAGAAISLKRELEVREYYALALLAARVRRDGRSTPTEIALANTGEKFHLSSAAISHIVSPRKARK